MAKRKIAYTTGGITLEFKAKWGDDRGPDAHGGCYLAKVDQCHICETKKEQLLGHSSKTKESIARIFCADLVGKMLAQGRKLLKSEPMTRWACAGDECS